MKRYFGIALGLGLVLVVLAVTNAGPALAQGAIKPIMAFIVNDSANPVPVTVVPPPPQTSVTCAAALPSGDANAAYVNISIGTPRASFVCSGGVTSIDVSRITYTPDINAGNIASYRLTVIDGVATAQNVVGIVTDGAPDAAVVRPFRFDSTAPGVIQSRLSANAVNNAANVFYGGALIFIGTPAQ